MNNKDAFFVVWCPQAHTPTKQHWTAESAHEEAKRLARVNRGREFVVLMAVTSYQVADLVETQFIPQVPF